MQFRIEVIVDPKGATAGAAQANAAMGSVSRSGAQLQAQFKQIGGQTALVFGPMQQEVLKVGAATDKTAGSMAALGKAGQDALKIIKIASFTTLIGQAVGAIQMMAGAWDAFGEAAVANLKPVTEQLDRQLTSLRQMEQTLLRKGEAEGKGFFAGMTSDEAAAAVRRDFGGGADQRHLDPRTAAEREIETAEIAIKAAEAAMEERERLIEQQKQAALEASRAQDAADLRNHNEWLKRQEERKKKQEDEIKRQKELAEELAKIQREIEDDNAKLANDAAKQNADMLDDLQQKQLEKQKESADQQLELNRQIWSDAASALDAFAQSGEKSVEQLMRALIRLAIKAAAMKAALAIDPTGGLGGLAGVGAGLAASLFGFANGGDFIVGGAGGTDSRVVAFRATPGEHVSVRRPDQAPAGGQPVNIQVVNRLDPDDYSTAFNTGAFERSVINVMRRNPRVVQRIGR